MNKLSVLINNELVFEFDRNITFDEHKLAFLNRMDNDMDKGIKVRGELQLDPGSEQRATFVVMNLIKALQQENEAVISASCAYLVNRHPALIEVHANDDVDSVKIEFIDEDS